MTAELRGERVDESEAEYIKRTGSNSGYGQKYNAEAVNKGINSAYKGAKGPTNKQRSVTHALLRGRGDAATKLDAACARFDRLDQRMADRERADAAARVDARARDDAEDPIEGLRKLLGGNSGRTTSIYQGKESLREVRIRGNDVEALIGKTWKQAYVSPSGLRKVIVKQFDA